MGLPPKGTPELRAKGFYHSRGFRWASPRAREGSMSDPGPVILLVEGRIVFVRTECASRARPLHKDFSRRRGAYASLLALCCSPSTQASGDAMTATPHNQLGRRERQILEAVYRL